VFFPYADDNPTRHGPPIITLLLIGGCAAVYLLFESSLGSEALTAFFLEYGFVPAAFFGESSPTGSSPVSPLMTLVTCMFAHGGLAHLLGNMWFLWLYGDNVEDAFGPVRFVAFYMICGIAGTLAHGWLDPTSEIPVVGASGAISGVIGAYLLIWPRANIRVFYWLFFFIGTLHVPAFLVLGLWFAEQLYALPDALAGLGGVAIAAHLAGFLTGLVLTPLLKRPGIPLLQSPHSRAFSRAG